MSIWHNDINAKYISIVSKTFQQMVKNVNKGYHSFLGWFDKLRCDDCINNYKGIMRQWYASAVTRGICWNISYIDHILKLLAHAVHGLLRLANGELCARSRYRGQGHITTSHSPQICTNIFTHMLLCYFTFCGEVMRLPQFQWGTLKVDQSHLIQIFWHSKANRIRL